jgi:polar amino acid transport system substrate-binding protein
MRAVIWAGLLGIGLMCGHTALAGETLDRVTKSGQLVNALVNDYPPFSSIDDKNQVVGFDVDVAQAVADKLGVKLKLETPAWEAIVAGGWHGRFDLSIGSMTPSTERAKVLDFPAIYYNSPGVLVVHKDNTAIHSAADLTGKRVGAGIGSSYGAYLNRKLVIEGGKPIGFPFGDVQVVPSDETVAFQNLALGPGVRLDAIVADLATTKARIDAGGPFRIVGPPLYAEPNAVAIDKGDPEWAAKIKQVIDGLRADGTLARISYKWLGADVTAPAN